MRKNSFFSVLLSVFTLSFSSLLVSCEDTLDLLTGVASLELSAETVAFELDGSASDDNNGQLELMANRDWKISIPTSASWLSVDHTDGDSDQTLTFSVSAATSYREATVTIELYNSVGTMFSKVVTVTQGPVIEIDETTIAHAANADNVGTAYTDLSGTVVAVTSVSYVVMDATGGILVYAGGTPAYSIGDVVTISGTTVPYGGLGQFDTSATVTKTDSVEVDFSSPEEMSGSDLDTYIAGTPTVKYAKYTGTLSESGSYVNITINDASSAKGSITYAPTGLYDSSLVDAEVDVYGYLVGVSGTVFVQTAAVCIVAAGDEFELPESDNTGDDNTGDDNTGDDTTGEDVDLSELPQVELTGEVMATDFTSVNAEDAPSMIFGNYAVVWSVGSNSSSFTPKYYESGDAIRMYIGNTMTITTVDETPIKSIDLGIQSSYYYLTCNTGTLDNGSWTGEASSVTFTSSASHTRISSIVFDGYQGDGYVAPLYEFALTSLPETADTADTTYTIEGVDFVAYNIAYSSSYGNATFNEGSYLYNSSAINGEFVTITLQYSSSNTSYHTAKLYAGTSANPDTEMTTTSTSGTYVSYSVPAGTTHFKVASTSGFFYLVGVELTNVAIEGSDDPTTDDPTTDDPTTDDPTTDDPTTDDPTTDDPTTDTPATGVTGSEDYVDWSVAGLGLDNSTALSFPYTYGDYTLMNGGTGSTTPKYYSTGDSARFYTGDTLTITNTNGDSIESIVITCYSSSNNKVSADGAVVDGKTCSWSGDATSVTFSFSGTTYISSISINGGEADPIVSTVVTMSEFYSSNDGTAVTLENITVDYIYGSYIYVSNTSGLSALVYDSEFSATVGQVVTLTGIVGSYSDVKQLTSVTVDSAVDGGTVVTAIELTMADYVANYTDYLNQFICIKGVTVSEDALSQGDSSIIYYNRYSLSECPTSGTCDVYGYGNVYGSTVQIYPTAFENIAD